ncbi:MAG: hypothetical protein U5J62_06350 [Desulfurivibrio sp.]|nr:hypothetical protein [Desulfurivibrio sp.]
MSRHLTSGIPAPAPLTHVRPAARQATHGAGTDLAPVWNGNGGVGEANASLSATRLSTSYSLDCRFVDDGNAADTGVIC